VKSQVGTYLHCMHARPLGNVPVFSSSVNLTLREDFPVGPSQICRFQTLVGLKWTELLPGKFDVPPNREDPFEAGCLLTRAPATVLGDQSLTEQF